jgi:hypothetical protein
MMIIGIIILVILALTVALIMGAREDRNGK